MCQTCDQHPSHDGGVTFYSHVHFDSRQSLPINVLTGFLMRSSPVDFPDFPSFFFFSVSDGKGMAHTEGGTNDGSDSFGCIQ